MISYILIITCLCGLISAENDVPWKGIRPGQGGPPTNVTVDMYVRSGELNEEKAELETTLTFRMTWKDSRISVSNFTSASTRPKVFTESDLWIPDIFFGSEKSSSFHNVLFKNQLIRVEDDGTVTFSIRITVHSFCNIDSTRFPFDRHICNVTLESYGHTSKELNLSWKNRTIKDALKPRGSYILYVRDTYKEIVPVGNSTYDRLIIEFGAYRIQKTAVYRFFLPASIITMISWAAFYIHPEDITVRILLGILSMISTFVLNAQQVFFYPGTSTTAIDMWTIISVILGALSVLESVLVNLWNRNELLKIGYDKPIGYNVARGAVHSIWANRLDTYSRIAFPTFFIIFNIIFWNMYL